MNNPFLLISERPQHQAASEEDMKDIPGGSYSAGRALNSILAADTPTASGR